MRHNHGQADAEGLHWPEGVVTLLLTDIEGSTRAWEAHPEAMSAALARHDALIAEVVKAHGGVFIKSRGEGDATFSVFPRATDAALAAVALQRAIRAEPWPEQTPLSVRVAIHTGEAQLRDGDYFGTAVNRAARLRAAANGGEILCSQATAGIIADALPTDTALADRGPQVLKDLSRPEHVFSLQGAGIVTPVRKVGSPARRHARPFVGRAREVDVASTCLADALDGHGGALLLAGEPGIGKTRLAEVVEARAQTLRAPVVWGRCVEDEGAPPFWPWRQVLSACLAAAGGHPPVRSDARSADLALLVPDLQGSNNPAAPLRTAGPSGGEERFRLFEAVTTSLVEAAVPAGLVVILDDLHWADPSSALLLAHVGRDLATSRVLLVATYRDREVGPDHPAAGALASLARERGTVGVRLEGLAEVEVADQLEATFGHRFGLDVVVGVTRRSGGNPFFVAEIGRLLDANNGPGGNAADAWDSQLPEGVRAVIAQRLDRLSPACRGLLRTAAVVGADIDVSTIATLCGKAMGDALAELDDAVLAGLITATPANAAMKFSHALVRDTLHGEVPIPLRLDIHRRTAQHIETTHVRDLERYAAVLAHHWLSALPAADAGHAVEWAERAAADALAALAYEDAARLYQRALKATGLGGFAAEDRHRLLLGRAEALFKSGDVGAAIDAASEAGSEATRLGNPVAMAGAALVLEGVSDDAWGLRTVQLCQDALSLLGDDEIELRARLLAALAVVSTFTLRSDGLGTDGLEQAERLSREALALAEASGAPAARASALRARQMVCATPDGVHERLEVAARMLALAAETGDSWAGLWGRLWRIEAHSQLGETDLAEANLQPLAQITARLNQPVADWHLARTRCALAIGRGRFSDADRYLEEATALANRGLDSRGRQMQAIVAVRLGALTGDPKYDQAIAPLLGIDGNPTRIVNVAYLHAARGELEQAAEFYAELPPWTSWQVPHFVVLAAIATRGRVAAALGDVDGATHAYERLKPWADFFVVGGTGLVAPSGSAQLVLGCLAACMRRTETALRWLRAAVAANRTAGLTPFEIESRYELAKTLAVRGRREDRSEALVLAGDAAREAALLGMRPVRAQAEGLVASMRGNANAGAPSGLSPREREIAALVARGLTNRQIADVLHVAERTAENHVQHILTKLGFQNRTQIAGWATNQNLGDATRN